jgi:hypothetical protein
VRRPRYVVDLIRRRERVGIASLASDGALSWAACLDVEKSSSMARDTRRSRRLVLRLVHASISVSVQRERAARSVFEEIGTKPCRCQADHRADAQLRRATRECPPFAPHAIFGLHPPWIRGVAR